MIQGLKKLSTAIIAVALLICFAPSNVAYAEGGSFTIIHTTDIHARYTNFPALAELVSQYREKGEVLLVDSGDLFHGLPFSNLVQGESIAEILELIGYDVMTTGNHDYGYGLDRLLELTQLCGINALVANDELEDGGDLFEDYIVLDYDGVKVGIFGIANPDTKGLTAPANTEGLIFNDPVEAALEIVAELEKEADFIIAVTHLGSIDEADYTTSVELLKEVEGIDLILDGHAHVVYEEEIGGRTIVASGNYLERATVIEVTDGKIANISTTVFDKESAIDADVQEVIDAIKEEQKPLLSQVVGETNIFLNGERQLVRTHETNLGRVITDAYIYETGGDIAFENGGGIRSSIKAGEITYEDIYNVQPFGNVLVTKSATGAEIVEMLEEGLSSIDNISGGFLHSSGITMEYDSSKEAGGRVISVSIDGKPIDKEKEYTLAINNYLADTLPQLADKPILAEYGATDEALAFYLMENEIAESDSRYTDKSEAAGYRILLDGIFVPTNKTLGAEDENIIPLRKVCEALGFTVEWSEPDYTITISNDSISAVIYVKENTISLMGQAMPITLEIVDGTTYVPMNPLIERNIYIDAENMVIVLSKN